MLTIKKILCPCDFSEFSNTALGAACDLANSLGAELRLLHVLQPVPKELLEQIDNKMSLDCFRQTQMATVSWRLKELAKSRAPETLVLTTEVRYGDAAKEIIDAATENADDLIVIARHGERNWRYFVSGSAFEKFVMGSVTDKVIRSASCPVMTVPQSRLHMDTLPAPVGASASAEPKAREEIAC